ncbi:MAG: hypothetical protein UX99_C0004G0007 [Candidatus Amesbacteria bacterium GW2011_GWB1_47_26]|uniref:Uncharacterized protein n=1 Tax=Candidatus Amesbacteria bacterium GW2011_GWC2_45_19 TaxID=1618366 RepID=A0A0G1M4C5_9BACT|nr:MAG: hypothetical protein UX05_C0005G0029 [Candidatus Amesbacteria bacterium GW2011_GWC2_45_19]KKU38365.1 MAG: hypothetical protein UX52_C0007G0018 [Candidatus Amesbacteria bacterium GW2011_GWA1_46_35]KKU68793.1 MAG: hypothetical protein UX93_C0005G0029 [Microgenomates group bacterium GW2011_GWC1_47_20]KKU74907.1 MAG: hypothetical protein UX99_C0004G0007 [Candidatus Amesbacteria bacterium GW2011_GWB1_47_26]KKU80081.1 MAG: hypothetical protein UY06_C0006G0010 [Candidatus Amesbacteria bacteriu
MAETLPTPIKDCPKDVKVTLNPNSLAMKYIQKRLPFFTNVNVITSGRIFCPAINKGVEILVAAKPVKDVHLFCRELMEEKCPFANYESPEA